MAAAALVREVERERKATFVELSTKINATWQDESKGLSYGFSYFYSVVFLFSKGFS